MNLRISAEGLSLIKQFEGLKLHPYFDSSGIPTIGYGTCFYSDGTKVKIDDPSISEERATELLAYAVMQKADCINQLVMVDLNQNQFDALCSLVYNIGQGNFQTSTLLFLLNEGLYQTVPEQFIRWNMANHIVIQGLNNRRIAEAALFDKAVT